MQTFAIGSVAGKLKSFIKDRVCLLNKFAVDLTLILKAVPSHSCKMQIKSTLVVHSPGQWLKTLGPRGSGCNVETRHIE